MDMYPTLVDYAGLPKNPANEGMSLRDLLEDPKAKRSPVVIDFMKGNHAVRDERFRYIRYHAGDLLQVDYLWNADLLLPPPAGRGWTPGDWSNTAGAADPAQRAVMPTLPRRGQSRGRRVAGAARRGLVAAVGLEQLALPLGQRLLVGRADRDRGRAVIAGGLGRIDTAQPQPLGLHLRHDLGQRLRRVRLEIRHPHASATAPARRLTVVTALGEAGDVEAHQGLHVARKTPDARRYQPVPQPAEGIPPGAG